MMQNLTRRQEILVTAALNRIPPAQLIDATSHVERLLFGTECTDADVVEALNQMLDRYRVRY